MGRAHQSGDGDVVICKCHPTASFILTRHQRNQRLSRGKSEIQQAKEEQLEISALGDELSVWDVGTNLVIETWPLASVTLPPPSYEVTIKENNDSLSLLQLETIKYAFQQHERRLPDHEKVSQN